MMQLFNRFTDTVKGFVLRTVAVSVLLVFAGTALSAKVYLVAVGVNDYSNFPGGGCNNLSLSIKDAGDVANLYGKNTLTERILLTDASATKANVKNNIKQLFDKASADDIVVFYFSGHGYKGGFCVSDGRLTYADIRKAMSTSRCKNKMMFLDTCHSGSIRQNHGNSSVNQAKKANVMLFVSSRDSEISTEDHQRNNGRFTAFLLKGLKGGADANRDRTITARELYDYVHSGVIKSSGNEQHPVMWGKFSNTMPVMIW